MNMSGKVINREANTTDQWRLNVLYTGKQNRNTKMETGLKHASEDRVKRYKQKQEYQ